MEQIIGRGLRLSYGKYTGVKRLIAILSHMRGLHRPHLGGLRRHRLFHSVRTALRAGGADGAAPAQLFDGRRGAQRAARGGKTHRQGYSRTDDGAFLCQGGGL